MRKKNWFLRHKWLVIIIAIVVVGVFAFRPKSSANAVKNYITVNVTRGNLSQTVTATGEIMPLNTVSVASF